MQFVIQKWEDKSVAWKPTTRHTTKEEAMERLKTLKGTARIFNLYTQANVASIKDGVVCTHATARDLVFTTASGKVSKRCCTTCNETGVQ